MSAHQNLITVLLADDHAIVREGLNALLATQKDLKVVSQVQDGRQAVQWTRKLHPAVVVMDIGMPQLNGLEATRQIRKIIPETRVLILSAHSEDMYVQQAMSAGAAGFLNKETSSHIVSHAIREVALGNTFCSPSISKRLHDHHRHLDFLDRQGMPREGCTTLSTRETEVLQLIAEGMANKQMGDQLGISIKTVEKHRNHLMEKLNIRGTAGLTRYATAMGIVDANLQLA